MSRKRHPFGPRASRIPRLFAPPALAILSALPVGAVTPESDQGVTAILHRAWIADGYAHVLGELRSTRTDTVRVRLVVERQDAAAEPLAVQRWEGSETQDGFYPDLDVLPPGGRIVFSHTRDLAKVAGEVRTQRVRIDRVRTRPDEPAVVIADLGVEDEPGGRRKLVRGSFVVPGDADCRSPTLVLAGYADDDRLAGVSTHDPRDPYPFRMPEGKRGPLARGSVQAFAAAIEARAPGVRIVRVEAFGECQNHSLQ